MIRRVVPLLIAVAIVFAVAPQTMASDCYRCKIVPAPQVSYCIPHTNTSFYGWTVCESDETGCRVSGDRCKPAATAALESPLASEFRVASVERTETQTAETAPAATAETATLNR